MSKKHACALIFIVALWASLAASCDDFLEKDISDKRVEVIAPVDSAELAPGRVSFLWREMDHATAYRVQVVSPNFQHATAVACDTLLNDTLSANNKLSLTLPAGSYQWSIQAENGGYRSLMEYLSFQVIAADDEEQ
ncbi:MAG: hypothetical protein LBN29_03365 [Mediterranea sp.]|jgi:stress-induced morphogen|nr:hypothetical protein [Mediterranea sp.]